MGELSPVTLSSYGVGKLVSVLVSVADSLPRNPLLHMQLGLEARVGIEPTHRSSPAQEAWKGRGAVVRNTDWAFCGFWGLRKSSFSKSFRRIRYFAAQEIMVSTIFGTRKSMTEPPRFLPMASMSPLYDDFWPNGYFMLFGRHSRWLNHSMTDLGR